MKWLILLAVGGAACAGPRFSAALPAAGPVTAGLEVSRVELQWSNVYLLRQGAAIALVDSGTAVDRDALAAALAARGIAPSHIKVVVVTHAHADHAGLARWLQVQGAAIVLGAGDVAQAALGHNEQLAATSLIAAWLAPTFMLAYEPFRPDVAVERELDLGAYGLPAVRVVPVPGHTPGAVAVVVGDQAFAGDLLKGGWLATFFTDRPSEHFYQADLAADHRAIAGLLARGVRRMHLGHGGPVEGADVAAWLATADEPALPRAASIELGINGELPTAGGAKGLTGWLRARYAVGAYLGGLDVRTGWLGGGQLEVDLHALGVAWRGGGAMLGMTGGIGIGGLRGNGATRLPIELGAEVPVGPVRLIGRVGAAWRISGARWAGDAHGVADEVSAMAGVRLGRDVAWGRVVASKGPYVGLTYRDLGGVRMVGLALGVGLGAGE